MKKTFAKMIKPAVALFMSLLMIFSVCSTALVVYASAPEKINYVSLGDSMTNGYGLEGYDAEAGVYDYGYASYANKFAEMLAAENGWNGNPATLSDYVEHAQLAMSAMRPEDLNFLLRLDYDDPAVSALIDKYPTDDKVYYRCSNHSGVAYDDIVYCYECKWDWVTEPGYDVPVDDYPAWWTLVHGDNWENLIGYGDFWTWKELAEDYRFGTAATYIKYNYGTPAERARAMELMASRPAKPRDDGSNGQETCYVAAHYQKMVAEADVISLALGNGNFGVWLMGRITDAIMSTDGVGRNGAYDLDRVLAMCSPDLRAKAYEILDVLDPYIEMYVNTMMGSLSEAKRQSVKDVATYAVVSFLVNYRSTLERILELNPDVEIIVLGLMNTYAGDDAMATEGTVTIGTILDVLFPPLNMYIAGLPTYFQSIAQNDLYKNAKIYYAEEYTIECLIHTFGDASFYNWEGVSRDRFVTGLVGECDHDGAPCVDASKCLDWSAGLFWELLEGYEVGGIKIQNITIQDVKDYEKLTNAERAAFAIQNQDKAASVAIYLAIEDAVCKSGRLAPVTLTTLTSLSLDASLLGTALTNFNIMLEQDIGAYYETATQALNAAGVAEPSMSDINDISMVLAVPTTLSNALWTDPDLCSMLAVVARNKIGNGLGAHPSVAGHASLAVAMKSSYNSGWTTQDQTVSDVMKAYEAAYNIATAPADYYVKNGSSYVALGDGTGYSQIFADTLAQYVAAKNPPYGYNTTNLTVADSKISALTSVISQNFATIANADLVSVGYSYDTLAQETIYIVFDLLLQGVTNINTNVDWASMVGSDIAVTIESKLAEVYASLVAQGMNVTLNEMLPVAIANSNVTIADAVITAAEYFAYYAAEYAIYLPQVVNTIHAINPDALVMVLAMSNPLSDTKISLMGDEIAFGDYLDYLVEVSNIGGVLYTAVTENVVFVPATEVETNHTDYTINVGFDNMFTLYQQYILRQLFVIDTTAAGNAYVVGQMFNALDITVEINKLGDANGDGMVTFKDAILVARYEAGLEHAIDVSVSDVDGDGHIGFKDAILIARYEAGLVESFPASK